MKTGALIYLPFYFELGDVLVCKADVYGIIIARVRDSKDHVGEYEVFLPHINKTEIFYSCEFEIITYSCG